MMGTQRLVRSYDISIDDQVLEEISLKGYNFMDLFILMSHLADMDDEQEIHYVKGADRNGEKYEGWLEDDETSVEGDEILYTVVDWDCVEVSHDLEE